jgi:hypothetical protein
MNQALPKSDILSKASGKNWRSRVVRIANHHSGG